MELSVFENELFMYNQVNLSSVSTVSVHLEALKYNIYYYIYKNN